MIRRKSAETKPTPSPISAKCAEVSEDFTTQATDIATNFRVSEASYRTNIRKELNGRLKKVTVKTEKEYEELRSEIRDDVFRGFNRQFDQQLTAKIVEGVKIENADCVRYLTDQLLADLGNKTPQRAEVDDWTIQELAKISGPRIETGNRNLNSSGSPADSSAPTNSVSRSAEIPVGRAESPPASPPMDFPWLPVVLGVGALIAGLLFFGSKILRKLLEKRRFGRNAGSDFSSLKKAIGVKNELTNRWLKKRASKRIHAIGVGLIDGTDDYCVQIFVDGGPGDVLEDPPTRLLPPQYRDLPIVVYEMPRAAFLSSDAQLARGEHQTLRGGISAANANLGSESGTLGYFFRPNFIDNALHVFTKNHVYLLSNAHVFADLRRDEKDESDLIMRPSPGEGSSSRPVADLYNVHPIVFGGDVEQPNLVDAAIAKILRGVSHAPEIPGIGVVKGFLGKEAVEIRSKCRKFGRTTGLTNGRVFSFHLSIWIRYDARGTEAFFKDQFLIVPEDAGSFVKPGDSGSLVVDDELRAIGLIFAGAGGNSALQFAGVAEALDLENLGREALPKIDNYGVANSISDVMKAFSIKPDQKKGKNY